MNAPANFEMAEGYACFRPTGQVSIQQAVEMVGDAITFTAVCNATKLLVDTTQLTRLGPLGVVQRFDMGEQLAYMFSRVKVAIVARPESIDPEHFGITVGRNRGLNADVFDSETDALAWLLDLEAE